MKKDMFTAIEVPGRKIIPSKAIVFIAELSLLVSIAICRIIALSPLLAFAIAAELRASSILNFVSFCAMNWYTCYYQLVHPMASAQF